MDMINQFQADFMMLLSGVCGIMAFFVHITQTMSRQRKRTLMGLELCAMFMMIADRRSVCTDRYPDSSGTENIRKTKERLI